MRIGIFGCFDDLWAAGIRASIPNILPLIALLIIPLMALITSYFTGLP